jgi:hypothetical protein
MSQWPLVVNRLVTLLPTLSGWSGVQVFDGRPVVVENVDYCLVGYANEDDQGNFDLGTFGEELSAVGNAFEQETGTVDCQVSCNSGDDDLSVVRARLTALFDSLAASLKADRTLGVLPYGSVASVAAQIVGTKNAQGTGITAIFTVSYVTQAF